MIFDLDDLPDDFIDNVFKKRKVEEGENKKDNDQIEVVNIDDINSDDFKIIEEVEVEVPSKKIRSGFEEFFED